MRSGGTSTRVQSSRRSPYRRRVSRSPPGVTKTATQQSGAAVLRIDNVKVSPATLSNAANLNATNALSTSAAVSTVADFASPVPLRLSARSSVATFRRLNVPNRMTNPESSASRAVIVVSNGAYRVIGRTMLSKDASCSTLEANPLDVEAPVDQQADRPKMATSP